jgi:hypothetical protein
MREGAPPFPWLAQTDPASRDPRSEQVEAGDGGSETDGRDGDGDPTFWYVFISAVQAELDAVNGWEVDRTMEQAMDALRCPPPDALVKNLSGGAGDAVVRV